MRRYAAHRASQPKKLEFATCRRSNAVSSISTALATAPPAHVTQSTFSAATLMRALALGTVVAGYTIAACFLQGLQAATSGAIDARWHQFKSRRCAFKLARQPP